MLNQKKQRKLSLPPKICALIFGIGLWYILSDNVRITRKVIIPLCFYNNEQCDIQAPESVTLDINAPRTILRSLNELCAIHIDAKQLPEGKQLVVPTPQNLFLPKSAKIVYDKPITITVKKIEKEQQEQVT